MRKPYVYINKYTGERITHDNPGPALEKFKDRSRWTRPLYLPYKPYGYRVEWEPMRMVRGDDGVRRIVPRRVRYMRVDSDIEYMPRRYEWKQRMSDNYRHLNRTDWYNFNPSGARIAEDRLRLSSGKKVARLIERLWPSYKERRFNAALERAMDENRRRANVEIIDLTGDEPRRYKRHRPLNR